MAHPLDALNPNQRLAVTTTEGPVLVLAGPGSGKTRVLTQRIAYLITERKVPPYHIMATTFTNKAVGEMRGRVEKQLGISLRGMMLGTFHSICARILRQEAQYTSYDQNFTIYDTDDQRAVIKDILEAMKQETQAGKVYARLSAISKAKNELIAPDGFVAEDHQSKITKEVYKIYMKRLRANNAMDFDDLLMQTVILFRENPEVLRRYQEHYPYLLVDEFQDTNMAQYEMVRLLAQLHRNVFVVGDPDQSIYAFRGADYRNVKRFMQDFPDHKLITLDENYRSHQLILDAAMGVIRRNPDHIKRDLFSQRKKGPLVEIWQTRNALAEGDFVVDTIKTLMRSEGYRLRDFAIMYRTNAQSRPLENAFREGSLPYRIIGGLRFYDRKEIRDLLAYLHVINNPNDTQRLSRILNVPPRGIGKKTQEHFKEWVAVRGEGQWAVLNDLRRGITGIMGGRAAAELAKFADKLAGWIEAKDTLPLVSLLDKVLADTNYIQYLKDSEKQEDALDRLENIGELRHELMEHEGYTLGEYLAENSLLSDIDVTDPNEETVVLMTLHTAKGLEFPVVFIAGVEEGLLPHSRSLSDMDQLAEERRLMYVGITRAKDRLYLSYAETRIFNYGDAGYTSPSSFLRDLPPHIIQFHSQSYSLPPIFPYDKGTTLTSWADTGGAGVHRQANFKAGDVVYHPKYGEGIVVRSALEFDIEEVEVHFLEAGSKRLDGSYLIKRK